MSIYEMLHLLPTDTVEAVARLIRVVLASPDPARIARRYALMIAARAASEAALDK